MKAKNQRGTLVASIFSDEADLVSRPDVLKDRPISDHGNIVEIIGKFGGADQLRNAVNQLQSLLCAV